VATYRGRDKVEDCGGFIINHFGRRLLRSWAKLNLNAYRFLALLAAHPATKATGAVNGTRSGFFYDRLVDAPASLEAFVPFATLPSTGICLWPLQDRGGWLVSRYGLCFTADYAEVVARRAGETALTGGSRRMKPWCLA